MDKITMGRNYSLFGILGYYLFKGINLASPRLGNNLRHF